MHLAVVDIVAHKVAVMAEEDLAARHLAEAMVAEAVRAADRKAGEALRNQAGITRDGTIIDF
jgi:hypothetical protein